MTLQKERAKVSEKPSVSIIIPTKNEGNNLHRCLEAIQNQEIQSKPEILVIDSGSTDGSLDILHNFSGVRPLHIPPESFGHGKTRNFGASESSGDYVVFLNADALPANNQWLRELLAPLFQNPDVVASFSRHLPHPGCYFYMERDLLKSMPGSDMIKTAWNPWDSCVFSTVSGAIQRDFWTTHPFDDSIDIAEDQEWGRRVLEGGGTIVYAARSKVHHSHNYTAPELYSIKRRRGQSESRFTSSWCVLVAGIPLSAGGAFYKWMGDILFIFRKSVPLKTKFRECVRAFSARLASFWGRFRGWFDSSTWTKRPSKSGKRR